MSVVKYSYVPDSLVDPITKKVIGQVYRPKIPVKLGYAHRLAPFAVDCLVDSGSDDNVFPAMWGEYMGVPIKKGKVVKIYGIGGVKIETYAHRVKLYIGSVSINVEAHFSYEQNTPLLGRNGFFNCFQKVVFQEKERFISLEV